MTAQDFTVHPSSEYATNRLDEMILDLLNSATPEWRERWGSESGHLLRLAPDYDVCHALDLALGAIREVDEMFDDDAEL